MARARKKRPVVRYVEPPPTPVAEVAPVEAPVAPQAAPEPPAEVEVVSTPERGLRRFIEVALANDIDPESVREVEHLGDRIVFSLYGGQGRREVEV